MSLTLIDCEADTPAWWDRAACEGMDPDNFFPDHGRGITDAAKAACASCPVRVECLRAAIDEEVAAAGLAESGQISFYVHGYRGGRTATERIAMHRMGVRP